MEDIADLLGIKTPFVSAVETEKISNVFARNLANKLNVPVSAPTGFLLAHPNGSYYVAEKNVYNYTRIANGFKTFYPKRRNNK